MAYGMRIKNDSGVYQIDDTYKNLQFISKTTVTSGMTQVDSGTTYTGKKDYWYYDIVVTGGVSPVIAVNGNTGDYVSVAAATVSGSTFTFRVFAASNVTFVYYVFDVYSGAAPTGTYGLTVKDSAGDVTFTSARGMFIPVQFVSTDYMEDVKSTSLTGGRTYAVVTVAPGRQSTAWQQIGDPKAEPSPTANECSQGYSLGGFKLNGTSLYTHAWFMQWYDQFQGDSFECALFTDDEDNISLVIDVTYL